MSRKFIETLKSNDSIEISIEELEPGLDENACYDPLNFSFPSGCHICEVEVDPDTVVVEVAKFLDTVSRVVDRTIQLDPTAELEFELAIP